jgi:hypothetical protein
MRRLAACMGALLLVSPPLLTGCDDYDDSELWQNVNDLKSRIEALETKIGQMNTEIAALQKIVDDAVTVVKVEKSADGYVIYFSDNTTAEIKNGTAGADAPVIGVKQDTDEVYYWTITTDGKTEWLMAGGAKLRVTGESVKPVMSVDDEGYWTISYDGGKTSERILDAAGDPVSAVTEGSSIGSLFKSVNYDDNNVYFELSDGSIVTVPVRSNFYMLIRKAPEVATFVFGETKVWDVESAGVTKTLVSKPDEWKVTYADGKLTVTAPTEAHKECADLRGTVGITYFSANGQADAVMMDVVADADYRGETVGEDFTVNITEITDKNIKATVTPKDDAAYWYMGYTTQENIDNGGLDKLINDPLNGYLSMLGYYAAYNFLDMYAFKGAKTDFSFPGVLKGGTEFCAVLFGFTPDASASYPVPVTLNTEVMTVPFKTQEPVVINTVYRIDVSDVSWYGAKYVCVPSDDLGYLHGFVRKSEFDTYDDDAAFMKSRIDIYKRAYRDELESGALTWADLTFTETQTVVAPAYIEEAGATRMGLVDDTEYYVYAFSCTDGNATSPLSKAAFKTGKFIPSEECTFEITTTVERQDVTVNVVPSNRNVTYYFSVTRAAQQEQFDADLQFAVDDLIWTKIWAESQQITLSSLLSKGEDSNKWTDLWAATAYIVCAYGVSEDGAITTRPTLARFVTKGTIDQTSVKNAAASAMGGKVFRR